MEPPRRKSFQPPARRGRHGAPEKRDTAWDPVAAWYDRLVGESGMDYHRNVILPAAFDMLGIRSGESVVDVCCGQGVLARGAVEKGAGRYLGIDASGKLIAAARQRNSGDPRISFLTADACVPGAWADGSHDLAACLMAVHDVADAEGLFAQISDALKPGGKAVIVMMHPCFRIPRQTHWGWDGDQKIQYRRLDRYATPAEIPIATHPGSGGPGETMFFHRPLGAVLTALGGAGLAMTECRELCSHRRSQSGPFSKAEHRAAAEFPLFLALAARKSSG